MPVHNPRLTSATITLRFDDGSERTYDIHEGAKIGVLLTGGSNREPGEYAIKPGRHVEFEDELRMELHASATGDGPRFVTVSRTQADGQPRS